MLGRLVSATFVGALLAFASAPALAADDIEAKAQVCAGCHGENGVPTDPKTIPVIWGQQQSYLMKQLRNYRNGERKNEVMAPIAKGLDDGDLRKLAAYFAAKPWPAHAQPASAGSLPNGAAQCQPCHQPHFEGGMPAPRLAGLSYEFLSAQMKAFADGQRANNLDMPKFMQMLSDGDRDAIARYLATL